MIISKIQSVLQSHYKWLFSILLGIIIIAFVFTIGAAPRLSNSQIRQFAKNFYGYNLNDEKEVQGLLEEAITVQQLKGEAPSESVEEMVLTRALFLYSIKQLQLPLPTPSQINDYLRDQPLFTGKNGHFKQDNYKQFLTLVDQHPHLSREKLRDIVAHQIQLQEFSHLLVGPGYVLPYEAEKKASLANTIWSIKVATFDYETFNPKILVSTKALHSFFERNRQEYVIPSKPCFSYILFEKGSLREREEAANHFVYQLFEHKIPRRSPEFNKLTETLPIQKFDKDILPEKVVRNQASQLNLDRYYSDPLTAERGIVILLLDDVIPETLPPFEQIKEQVILDYKKEEKDKRFAAEGISLRQQLEATMQAGKSFSESAAEAKLTTKDYTHFSLKKPPEEISPSLLLELQGKSLHELSPMIIENNKGYFLYVTQKEAPKTLSPNELHNTMKELQVLSAFHTAQSITEEMIQRGLSE